jgi:hypothetical protein
LSAVIALFAVACLYYAVAAGFGDTVGVTAIAVCEVAVIALLVDLDHAIATLLYGAVGVTAVAIGEVSVITTFPRLYNPVATSL